MLYVSVKFYFVNNKATLPQSGARSQSIGVCGKEKLEGDNLRGKTLKGSRLKGENHHLVGDRIIQTAPF